MAQNPDTLASSWRPLVVGIAVVTLGAAATIVLLRWGNDGGRRDGQRRRRRAKAQAKAQAKAKAKAKAKATGKGQANGASEGAWQSGDGARKKASKRARYLAANGFNEDGTVAVLNVRGLRYTMPFERMDKKEGRRPRTSRKNKKKGGEGGDEEVGRGGGGGGGEREGAGGAGGAGDGTSSDGAGASDAAAAARAHEERRRNGVDPRTEEEKARSKNKGKGTGNTKRPMFSHVDRPVRAGPVEIVHDAGGVVVVNKPVPMAVQRSDCYMRSNLKDIVTEQLRERGDQNVKLMIINRLDICTSGVCIMATDKAAGVKIQRDIAERRVQKTYLARVEGDFPSEASCADRVDHKDALTTFRRIHEPVREGTAHTFTAWDGTVHTARTSLVLCLPVTGRNHQIRLHLQSLGHPILNDLDHGGRDVGMPDPYAGGDPALRAMFAGSTDARLHDAHLAAFDGDGGGREDGVTGRGGRREDGDREEDHEGSSGEDGGGEEGGRVVPVSARGVWREQKVWTRGIWLHAWKYKSKDGSWSFEAPLPPWAREDFEWMDAEARMEMRP